MMPIRLLRTISRGFHQYNRLQHNALKIPIPGEELTVNYITKEGKTRSFKVSAGDNLLDIAQEYDIEMEGACGGSCACSTCHVIVENAYYDKLAPPTDEEDDMLDLAFGLTETSRLGCQIQMNKEIDDITVTLPRATRNLSKDDFS